MHRHIISHLPRQTNHLSVSTALNDRTLLSKDKRGNCERKEDAETLGKTKIMTSYVSLESSQGIDSFMLQIVNLLFRKYFLLVFNNQYFSTSMTYLQ